MHCALSVHCHHLREYLLEEWRSVQGVEAVQMAQHLSEIHYVGFFLLLICHI